MVNMPYRSSDLVAGHLTQNLHAVRRMIGAIAAALLAGAIVALLLRQLPPDFGGKALQELVPVNDPVAAATFTA